ncbi:peptide-methionine (R)-S-oxide reductase MsrB [Flavobacteriaceae bacterium]|jgi:peptide-methionine (R)-S-oxide reductase|nr:peptide-methionine (R)-S-oxide reductase MsrB [Flavobacteriaceae bacterium]MDA7712103.1 peptide-methionine (R)-S-oxide reductase MsrB [Flavobacteriaceae bacterium]MDA8900556.1 peptide-methionine (R)-S-oxide reductase MsrB [Flavobacteriaceae bacterium]MDB4306983.1 peptide-methionine (R)-S-oxide reductase MsrB [Flavobacteriaceae bacterium]
MKKNNYPVQKTEAEWRAQLSADEYRILREKGTEYAFTGVYNDHFEKGVYCCKGCGQELYDSSNKFDSHCGWPSYDAALPGALEFINDESHGMRRTEIVCARCGGHQGHVFNDGPTETGERYCVNAASIDFLPKEK